MVVVHNRGSGEELYPYLGLLESEQRIVRKQPSYGTGKRV
jgi:hypothetical protein